MKRSNVNVIIDNAINSQDYLRTADGKVPTTSISVPFLILGSK